MNWSDVMQIIALISDFQSCSWNQIGGRIMVSGNVNICRIWDAHAEKTVQDIPVGVKNCCVTHLCSEDTGCELISLGNQT